MSDTEALLAAARQGDRGALDALIARHQGRLLAFIRVRLGPDGDAAITEEDVLQETLVEASRKLHAFEYRGGASLYRWLVAIARFKVSDALRAARAHKRAAVGELRREPAAADTSASQVALRRERARRVRDALQTVPPDQAEAVRLRYLEGCTVRETAETMGRSEMAVKSLVARGLDALSRKVTRGG